MPRSWIAALSLFALVVVARPAAACRCLPPPLGKAVRAADVVFVGTIARVDVTDHAIATVGVRAVWIRQLPEESDLGRRFALETTDGRHGVVQVFDPDRRTSQLISQLTRIVRVRTWVARSPGWSERAQVQQAAGAALRHGR